MSVTEIENYRELILENIEYDCLKRRYPLYPDYPHEIVRSRFLKLDSSHIEFVMDCLQKNTTQVRNIKQYLLAVLFNAPTTMNNQYTSLVNHDMHAGVWYRPPFIMPKEARHEPDGNFQKPGVWQYPCH